MRAMKDSGIEWIGRIPENWATPPLRSKYSFGKGLAITKADLADDGAPVISYGQIHAKDNIGVAVRDTLIRYLPLDHSSLTESSKTESGDLIFADTSEDVQGCGNCVYIDRKESIYAGYHTLILRPKVKGLGRYYAYLFASDAWRSQVRANVAGVKVYSITQDILKKTILLEPPSEEQEGIVAFLDAKCSEIDSLIAAKEKTNALLKERRQSLIYEAVTKGLNPTTPMKDSGIEWIGVIPEQWKMERIKFHATLNPSTTIPFTDDESTVSFIPMDCLKQGYHAIEESEFGKVKKGYVCFQNGDILIAKVTPCFENGNIAIAEKLINNVGFGSTEINVIRCFDIDTRYLFYMLQCKPYIEKATYDMYGVAGLKRLTPGFIPNSVIPIPPTSEQVSIANHIDQRCSEIDALIAANVESIDRLKEYRQSLIYEAVTGKIEV